MHYFTSPPVNLRDYTVLKEFDQSLHENVLKNRQAHKQMVNLHYLAVNKYHL